MKHREFAMKALRCVMLLSGVVLLANPYSGYTVAVGAFLLGGYACGWFDWRE